MSNLLVGPLVRAIRPDGVAIWTEWSDPCEVTLTATPTDSPNPRRGRRIETRSASSAEAPIPPTADVSASATSRTVTVGGRHYALSQLTGLQSATWYTYRISDPTQGTESSPAEETIVQCFRTLDLPDAALPLRLAYGSCRKLSTTEPDALSALGDWLIRFIDEREARWPHLLFLVGDQIYADEHVGRRKQRLRARQSQASHRITTRSFEDFARIYVESWTVDQGIRQIFAILPTYMIFDDHEIINSWNISPMWRAYALHYGLEQTLVDGLVAYWVYQGWGNIGVQDPDEHPLLAIMQKAAQNNEDALPDLRARIRQVVYKETPLQWHYAIPTVPPIFVADVREDRPAILDGSNPTGIVPRIMSHEQMLQLRAWMQVHASTTTLLVSSVPAILPPIIGLAEYIMGVRPFHSASSRLLHRFGRVLANIQQKLALNLSFDHWPVFGATWHELIELLDTRQHDLVVLSGDVHFSYAMSARRTLFPTRRRAALYQFVASPFKNTLEKRDKRLILAPAWIKRIIYSGFYTRVLPLLHTKKAEHMHFDMLFQNVVALVTFWPQIQGNYCIRQVYMGVKDRALEEVASTVVNCR